MRLVISRSICLAEFGQETVPEIHIGPLNRSRAVELAITIKGDRLPRGSRLLKGYVTTPQGARRVVHLLVVAEDTLFLLLYRDKKDAAGANISVKNPNFRKQLHKHLKLLMKDLESGEFEVWEED